MKLQSQYLADYLKCTPIIDWERAFARPSLRLLRAAQAQR
jgi:hypothetical protein